METIVHVNDQKGNYDFRSHQGSNYIPPLTCERPSVKGGHSKTSERPNVRLLLQEFIHDALGIVRMEKPATEKFTRRMPLGAWGLTIEETRAMRPGLTV